MSFADDVREYCIENYINPARNNCQNEITIRAGDIHSEMNYSNRMPLVCSALGSIRFESEANIERIGITGPVNGANALFKYRLLGGSI